MGTKELAIIGSYPPPYGGVSTHIHRLCSRLGKLGADYILYNAGSASETGERVISVYRFRRLWMLWYTLFGKERCVYILSPRVASWLAGAMMRRCRRKTVAVRLQSSAQIGQFHTWIGRTIVRFALRNVSSVVCVNRELVEAVAHLGVAREKIQLFPGFLPPTPADRNPLGVPEEVWGFCRSKSPLIVANGRIQTYKGNDLYGFDQLVALMTRLKPDFPDIGLVVCFWEYSAKAQAQLHDLIVLAKSQGVEGSICFNTRTSLFVPLLERADVFARPTVIDGDANSIREALYLGVPTVASDVVERPEGTIIYRCGDLDDFERRTREALRGDSRREAGQLALSRRNAEERARSYVDWVLHLTRSQRQVRHA